jgi:hypothetical protein
MALKREPKAVCSVCGQLVYDNVNPEKIIICGLCVQKRLGAFNERKSSEEKECGADREGEREPGGPIDHGSGIAESVGLEEAGIG